jgi:hypothetical protein
MAHRFFNTFVNTYKYIEQESTDGERAAVKVSIGFYAFEIFFFEFL